MASVSPKAIWSGHQSFILEEQVRGYAQTAQRS
eukprot:SAG31_NODE_16588_length_703_cov_1.011589_1_plen_32_part_10